MSSLKDILGPKGSKSVKIVKEFYKDRMLKGDYSILEVFGLTEEIPVAYNHLKSINDYAIYSSGESYLIFNSRPDGTYYFSSAFLGKDVKEYPERVKYVSNIPMMNIMPLSGVYGYMSALSEFIGRAKIAEINGLKYRISSIGNPKLLDIYMGTYPARLEPLEEDMVGLSWIPILSLDRLLR